MGFLDLFSLTDVAIVFTGLVIVSIIRIYYDSHVNRQKAERFGSSLGIYNSLLDGTKEGLLIIAEGEVVFSNTEAADILNVKPQQMEKEYLSTLNVGDEYSKKEENFLDAIQHKEYMPSAYITDGSKAISLSISVNKVKPYSHNEKTWYVIILQNMQNVNELREGAESLLAA